MIEAAVVQIVGEKLKVMHERQALYQEYVSPHLVQLNIAANAGDDSLPGFPRIPAQHGAAPEVHVELGQSSAQH